MYTKIENPDGWLSRWGYLLTPLAVSLGFALVFFIPFSQSNIDFARLRGEMVFNFSPMLALVYFFIAGGLIGVLRKQLPQMLPTTAWLALFRDFIALLTACTAAILIGFWLLNAAVPCMLESCESNFLQYCGWATLAFTGLMAFAPNGLKRSADELTLSDNDLNEVGCVVLLIIVAIGAVLALPILGDLISHSSGGGAC